MGNNLKKKDKHKHDSPAKEPQAAAATPAKSPVKDDKGGENKQDESFFDRNRTFKPKRKVAEPGTHRAKLHKTMKASMKATLGGMGDMKQAVQLPPGEPLNEWLAVNTVHFFNAASMVYGTCAEFCTQETCKIMSAGPKYEYHWADGVKIKKPIKMSAPEYIMQLFTWIDEQIANPEIFPVEEGAKFPSNFLKTVKNIFKRLFRLYAHIYYSHFEKIRSLGAEAHLNTCFKHLIFFILEFQLVDKKELEPLEPLIQKLQSNA